MIQLKASHMLVWIIVDEPPQQISREIILSMKEFPSSIAYTMEELALEVDKKYDQIIALKNKKFVLENYLTKQLKSQKYQYDV